MKLPLVLVAVVLFSIGVIRSQTYKSNLFPVPTPDVLSDSDDKDSSPNPTNTPSLTSQPTQKPQPSANQNTPTPSSNTWQYPGSSTKSEGVYVSTDDPNKITDWYKEKIRSSGMNVKNFVQTKTNGKVKNILSGAGEEEVKIEINKEPSDSQTTIIVTFES